MTAAAVVVEATATIAAPDTAKAAAATIPAAPGRPRGRDGLAYHRAPVRRKRPTMKTDTPQTVYLKDYTPPAFWIDTVDLDFDIDASGTTVTRRWPCAATPPAPASRWSLMARNCRPWRSAFDGAATGHTPKPRAR